MNLTEATILALQGKLNLQEDVEIETDQVEVTVGDDKTVIDTEDSTVTVEKNNETSTEEEPVEVEISEEIVSDADLADDNLDVEPVETSDEDTEEVISDENIETNTEDSAIEDTDTETEEDESEDSEEELDESKKLNEGSYDNFEDFQNEVKSIGSLYDYVYRNYYQMPLDFLKEIALNAIYEANNDEAIISDMKERVFESKSVTEECDNCDDTEKETFKYSSKTFNEAFEKYLKEQDDKIQKFNVKNLSRNQKGDLKIEAYMTRENKIKKVELKLEAYKTYNTITKYKFDNFTDNKKVESKQNKLKLITRLNKDKVLECKLITK
jgi:hypothetical protein